MTSPSTPLTTTELFEAVIQPFLGFASGSVGGDEVKVSATGPKWLLIEAEDIDVASILSAFSGVQKVTRVSVGLWKVFIDRDFGASTALYNALR